MFMLGTSAMMFLILHVPANGMAVAYGFGAGMFSGGSFAMLPVIYADYFGRSSIGTIRGLTHPVVMVANAAGPLTAGIIFDVRGEYSLAFQVFGMVTFIGATLVWFARPPHRPVDSPADGGDTGAR
jgi:MFS family permease